MNADEGWRIHSAKVYVAHIRRLLDKLMDDIKAIEEDKYKQTEEDKYKQE